MSLRAALFEDGHIAFDGAGHDLYQFKYESFARRDKLSHFPSVQKFDGQIRDEHAFFRLSPSAPCKDIISSMTLQRERAHFPRRSSRDAVSYSCSISSTSDAV